MWAGQSCGEPLTGARVLCWCCPGLCPHEPGTALGGRAGAGDAAGQWEPSWLPAALHSLCQGLLAQGSLWGCWAHCRSFDLSRAHQNPNTKILVPTMTGLCWDRTGPWVCWCHIYCSLLGQSKAFKVCLQSCSWQGSRAVAPKHTE